MAPRGATALIDLSRSPHARLRPVPVAAVRLEGAFWGARQRRNVEVALPGQYRQLEATGRLDSFRRAAGRLDGPARGREFDDSDLYKWIEAASWTLAQGPAAGLEAPLEQALALVEQAQAPDGYLDTYFSGERAAGRWTDLRRKHELYCAGHLVQAAVAHHRATGSARLLRVARRCADLVCSVFGPTEQGRRPGIDGHPEIELALVELYRETGERRYLEQARYFLEARGRGLLAGGRLGSEYHQDHAPFRALKRLEGHAVRALYYAAGWTDLYLETGEPAVLETLTRLWRQLVAGSLYVSGGLGARAETEGLGEDHELPNARAFAETCAAAGSIMWCQRLLAATGEARFADLLEWILFNALLPGWSLDGTSYFYANPLQDGGGHRRKPWFDCACCPPNVARTIASLPGHGYGTAGDEVFVHLYAQGTAHLEVGGRALTLVQRTDYPWDGRVELEVEGEGELSLNLRIPAWCAPGAASLSVNGDPTGVALVPGAYAALRRRWRAGDRVRLELPMLARLLESHPAVLENAGRVAIARGPLLYCLEGVDHPGVDLREVELPLGHGLVAERQAGLLDGAVVLRGPAKVRAPDEAWAGQLYRPVGAVAPARERPLALTAVPYFAWANRAPGPMQVWLRTAAR